MGKHHGHRTNNHDNGDKKALRRVEEARASYAKAEDRVATLRVRLQRAEEKLVRRATRLATVEEALATLAHAHDDTVAQATPETATSVAPMSMVEGDTNADDLTAMTAAPLGAPLTPVQAAEELARVAATAGNGAKPRRARSRRPSSATDEV